jgi:hypothetical protein
LRAAATRYLQLFAGRIDARQQFRRDRGHYVTIRGPLTPSVVLAAMTAKLAVGLFFLPPTNVTHVAAIDVDLNGGWSTVQAILSSLAAAGIVAYGEPSARGGHVWISLDDVLPAATIRRALRAAVERAGHDPDDPHIEYRPARDQLGRADGLGFGLRGPTFPHPKTGIAGRLVDVDGRVLQTALPDMVNEVRRTAATNIVSLARLTASAAPRPPITSRPLPPHSDRTLAIREFNATTTVMDVLAASWGLFAVPRRSIRCPAHEDRTPSLSIASDGRRLWCHSTSCVLNGRDGQGHDAYSLHQIARGLGLAVVR